MPGRLALLSAQLLFLVTPTSSQGQISPAFYDYVRRDLDWYTIETEHFLVHFHADSAGVGSSRSARAVARIAEEVYEPITSLYEYEPDTKVSFIIKDFEDYSNGAAYFFDNVIEIWAPAINTPYRGDHNWLRNVITHEFTHMIQVQKSMKGRRQIPFYYLQLLDYEDVRRPDVLYGFPNVIATYPVPILNNPAWLAEGTAQYQRRWMDYDRWDSHRDMLLRTRILAGEELSLADMGGFYSHSSLLRESVYNHGFAFTQYLAGRYSEEGLLRLTEALAQWSNWTFESAARDAFGEDGEQIYRAWISELRAAYGTRTEAIRASEVSGEILAGEGFNNFYPKYSPDGSRIAYLSNQGEDFSSTALYVLDVEKGIAEKVDLPGGEFAGSYAYTCSLGHRLVRSVSGPIDWHPEGNSIVYARTGDTSEGYLYSDLYTYSFENKSRKRLTRDQRASAPVWAPDGNSVAYVVEHDGSTNLYVLHTDTGEISRLTHFKDGSQVREPVWHPGGGWVYFGLHRGHGRDIYRVPTAGDLLDPVLSTDADERSPAFNRDGSVMYFVSDRTGIFNLYRTATAGGWESAEQITNEIGGAFMPDVSARGELVYAAYRWDGFSISGIAKPAGVPAIAKGLEYRPPSILHKSHPPSDVSDWQRTLIQTNDEDIRAFSPSILVREDDSGDDAAGTAPRRYSNTFTSFSFLPVLRLDRYVSRQRSRTDVRLSRRTQLETLWRNTKIGLYTASREILGGLSFFGGLLVAPGSRTAASFGDYISPSNLLKLVRDLFLQFEFNRGFGLIPKRWSPQVSVAMFNIRRNVENGLAIEEFPCTACFPDTTLTNLAYDLWELNLSARSKVSRSLLLEVGYRISPYQVTTERFFSKELQQSIPQSSSRYFIGRAARFKIYYETFHAYGDADVVPHGMRIEAGYEQESGRLLEEFSLDDGFLKPIYKRDTIRRVTVSARFGYRLPVSGTGSHGLGLRLRASSVIGDPVDDFYNDYVGGLTGARGYPFYALGGNETLWVQASYTFPLLPRVGKQFLFTYLDKIYARIYGDAALAWSQKWPGLENARKDAGIEMRIGLGSYYLLPTAIFVSATYGFDSFNFELDEGFVTPSGATFVTYGRDWQWHVGVLFGFDQF